MSETPVKTKPLDFSDYVRHLRESDPDLAAEFAGFTGVEHVLQWMQRRGLTKPPIDIVGQDEFSYDFLVQFEPQGRWLVFGVT
jgi:hypothetical protein